MAQARMAAAAICAAHGWLSDAVELVPMIASGDRVLDRALAEIGGKALWTKELDFALDGKQIDAAVHSMKDVETLRPASFAIAAMLPRADVRDRLIGADSIAALPPGAKLGTSSPRRRAQLLHLRPDLDVILLRGNVQRRLDAVAQGTVDATLLAAAGLDRLGMAAVGVAMATQDFLPAAAQGAVGIECRSDDGPMRGLLAAVNCRDTFDAVNAERALLAALGASCHSAVAVLASFGEANEGQMEARLYGPDGSECVAGSIALLRGDSSQPAALAARLMAQASDAVAAQFNP